MAAREVIHFRLWAQLSYCVLLPARFPEPIAEPLRNRDAGIRSLSWSHHRPKVVSFPTNGCWFEGGRQWEKRDSLRTALGI